MELNSGQQEALKIILNRYESGARFVTIAGYAGTGKSFLVRHAIQEMAARYDIDPEFDIIYTAYTGKACEVLAKRGNNPTSTLHKLLYYSKLKPNGDYERTVVDHLPCRIVVVDEVSMVPPEMIKLLASFDVFCIFLGDSFQIPPVSEDSDNGLLNSPHCILTQIMRQEEGGEVVQVATKVRNMEEVSCMNGENVMVLPKGSLTDGMLLWADVIICGTNKKRQEINQRIRLLRNYEGDLVQGEKIVCLHNNWHKFSDKGTCLMNGMQGTIISEVEEYEEKIPRGARTTGIIPKYKFNFQTDEGEIFYGLTADKNMMLNEKASLSSNQIYNIVHSKYVFILPEYFTYGNAITCHRAQGSQWAKVLVIEERFPFDKIEHARWVYTSLTRTTDKVVWIKC